MINSLSRAFNKSFNIVVFPVPVGLLKNKYLYFLNSLISISIYF